MWDSVWEKIFASQSWGKYPGEELIRFVARNFYKNTDRSLVRFLEIGCGPGANLWYLAREGFSFVGVDGSESAIAIAAERLDAECPGWRNSGELYVADIASLKFDNETFDAVIDNECVCCNAYEASVDIYSDAARVLKKGGKIFVRTFATGTWGDGTGECAGHNAWFCSEGPLEGKGFARFTDQNELKSLLSGVNIISTELLTYTVNEQKNAIKEWVVVGEK